MLNQPNDNTLEEQLAKFQGTVRALMAEKNKLQSEIDILQKEKEILLKALKDLTEMEFINNELKKQNYLLEGQINGIIRYIEKMNGEFGK
jgi:hypothetical protein